MPETNGPTQFTATQHALLFAFLARAIIRGAGQEQGEALVRRSVRRYGEERGRRMAQRALANSASLTMDDFLAYGELGLAEGEQLYETLREKPELLLHVTRCPWHLAWQGSDLMPYGRLYCLDVDEALLRGFNPELRLEVNGVLTAGAPYCEFAFHGVAGAESGRGRATMSWEYHAGHLFRTVREVVAAELGLAGEAAVEEALVDWSAPYGLGAAQIVRSFLDVDFSRPPD